MENNENQMNEMQEAIKLRHQRESGAGYSQRPQTLSDFDKVQERLVTEGVNMESTTVSVIEQTMREYENFKKLAFLEFKDGAISGEEYRQAVTLAQEVLNHLYNICETRMQYATKDPERWRQLIEISVGANGYSTERERLEVLRHVVERRIVNDDKLVEFDIYLKIQLLRKQLEQEYKKSE